MKNNSEHFT